MTDLTLHRDVDRSTEGLAPRLVERLRERGQAYEVRSGDERVGEVWLVANGEERGVLGLTLDHAEHAPDVRTLVEQLASSEGAVRLTVTVTPGDLVALGFVEGGGFAVAATQMRLDLAHPLPAEDVVVLEPMDEAGYVAWEAEEVESYAAERVLSGEAPERAREVSEQQHAELLPDGLATPHQHFFVARAGGRSVGTLWLCTERPTAFVYDVVVDEAQRRRGYGAGIMRAGALWAQERGAEALGLNVFGHNHGARALYDRLGYHVTEEFLGKPL